MNPNARNVGGVHSSDAKAGSIPAGEPTTSKPSWSVSLNLWSRLRKGAEREQRLD